MNEEVTKALETLRAAAAEKMARASNQIPPDEAGMDEAQTARTSLSNLERVLGD